MIGQIAQMALVARTNQVTDVFLWCHKCHVGNCVLESPDGMMRVCKGGVTHSLLAALSNVAVSALVAQSRDNHLEFRYVF